jgi:hypothetical protein
MTDYEKSNAIVEVDYKRLSKKEYTSLLADTNRTRTGQALLDYLCDKYNIRRIPLVVLEKPRLCIKNGQRYGFYQRTGMRGIKIVIYNITAKTNQKVAIKTFANTLLHEFIHHYDTEYLKIETMHTLGFNKRITDLQKKLSK